MPFNFSAVLLAPIYASLGTTTTYLLSDMSEIELVTIDKTTGIEVAEGTLDVQTIKPAATVRATDLVEIGITAADLQDAVLELGGREWEVSSYLFKPSPNGENDGEVWLLLQETN